MQSCVKKRIELTVDRACVAQIASCISQIDHVDFTVRPVLSGWAINGNSASVPAYGTAGRTVSVGFTVDTSQVAALRSMGFGMARGIDVPADVRDIPVS